MNGAAAPLPRMGGLRLLAAALATAGRSGRGRIDPAEVCFVAPGLDTAALRRFALAFGYPESAGVPLGFLYLLAQRAQVGRMLQAGFPHPLIGLVHVANEMRRGASLRPALPLDLACRAEAGDDAGGARITLAVRLAQSGELVAECRSTYLARRRGRPGAPRPVEDPPAGAPLERWTLRGDAGRRYARLSGDINPIHLWRWSARLFGFRRPIIHGMHTAGCVEAAVARATGRPLARLAVRFRRPIALPAEVALHASDGRFAVAAGGALCAAGEYEADAGAPASPG